MVLKLPFWGTVLTILGVCVLCALGFWQVSRLQWKQGLLDVIEAEYTRDAHHTALSIEDLSKPALFKRGYITGEYLHDKLIQISARTYKGTPGYHMVVPFRLRDGGIVLVNRGWTPIEAEREDDYSVRMPYGSITLVGGIRAPQEPSRFVPLNQPDRDVWYRYDLAQIAKVRELPSVYPNVFYLEERAQSERVDQGDSAYPIPQAALVRLNNNHAQYAIFWFTMAVMMGVVYVLRFIVPQYKSRKV